MESRLITSRARLAVLGLPVASLAGIRLAGAQSNDENPFINIPINFENAQGSFTGEFDITRFKIRRGKLVATGQLVGTVERTDGEPNGAIDRELTLPVKQLRARGRDRDRDRRNQGASAQATCRILDLVLGPLDLNLLGLRVQLNRVVLNVTGLTGALLGDLLCTLAGLLNGGGTLIRIARVLNRILRALAD